MDSFVVVRPTGTPMNETVGNRAKSEQDRAIPKWTGLFHEAPVKDNIAITDADIPATNAPAMIYPNPVNPKKLIVINRSNSWQVVQFPDYGVVDITSPATQAGRGEIARHRPSSARGG